MKRALALLAVVLVYVGLRAWLLATAFDDVSIPVYEHSPMGNLAAAVDGVGAQHAYGAPIAQYYDNCGGHLVTGLLAAPLFRVFGDSYLSLKLVPVGLGLLTLLAIFALVRCALVGVPGRDAAALCAALAFALGPPTITKYSMLAKGNHFENLVFQLAAVGLVLRAHQSDLRARWVFAAGVASGFAIFVYMGSLLTVAILGCLSLLVAAARGPAVLARKAGVAALGLFVGLLPVLWIQLASGGRVANFLAQKAGAREKLPLMERVPQRWRAFVEEIAPQAACFPDLGSLPGAVAELLFWGLFASCWLGLAVWFLTSLRAAWRAGRLERRGDAPEPDAGQASSERPALRCLLLGLLVGYLPVWFAAYSVGRFDFDRYQPPVEIGQFRYLVPHFLFATMLIGVALGAAWVRAGALAILARVGVAALAVTWLFLLPLGGTQLSPAALRYAGHDMRHYSKIVLRDGVRDPETKLMSWDEARIAAWVESLPVAARHATYFGIGYGKGVTLEPSLRSGALPTIDFLLGQVLADCPQRYQADVAWGLGSLLRRWYPQPTGGLIPRLVAQADASQHPLAPHVVEGLALEYAYPLARITPAVLGLTGELRTQLPASQRGSLQRGAGRYLGALWLRDLPRDREPVRVALSAVPEPEQADLWFGFGFGLIAELAGPATRPRAALELDALRALCPAAYLSDLFQGLGAGVRHVLDADAAPLIDQGLDPAALGQGAAAFVRGLAWPGYPAPYVLGPS